MIGVCRSMCWGGPWGCDMLDLILKFLKHVKNKKEKEVNDLLSEQSCIFP